MPVDDGLTASHVVLDRRKGRVAIDHLVEDTAQGPHIAGLAELHQFRAAHTRVESPTTVGRAEGVMVRVHKTLGGHVVGCADLRLAMDVDRLVCLDGVCNAKVDQLQAALHHNKVGGLQIAVDNVMGVNGCQTFEHFLPVEPDEYRVEF